MPYVGVVPVVEALVAHDAWALVKVWPLVAWVGQVSKVLVEALVKDKALVLVVEA